MRILVVEDNTELIKLLEKGLKDSGFQVDTSNTLEESGYKTEVNGYDAIILDVNLPDGSGIDFLKSLREGGNETPVLMLTVHCEVRDKVQGLNLGADDYLTKPFSMDELVARIRTLTKRKSGEKTTKICCGKLMLDQLAYEVYFNEKKLKLVKKEFMLLEFLMLNKGAAITRPQIWEHVWGLDEYPLNNTVDVHVASLRRKLKKATGEDFVKTVRGIGYKIEVD